jgi:hypothetical protein
VPEVDTSRDSQQAASSEDEDDGERLPIPIARLPAWWGPVASEDACAQLDVHTPDLLDYALDQGHAEDDLASFAREHAPTHRYLVCRRLSVTRFAAVYIAIDMLFDRTIVLKISLRRVDAEARSVVKIRHRNVVTVHDAFVWNGYPTIVLEWCSQGSLGDYARYASDLRSVLERALECGRGLAYCHAQNLVHGDVKPGNFLIADEQGKLADLGISRAPTLEGPVWGTPAYFPPERADGVWSFEGDVYAFGRVLEDVLIHGTLPERLKKAIAAAVSLKASERPSLAHLLDEVEAVRDEWQRAQWREQEREGLERELQHQREAIDRERSELVTSRIELDAERAQVVASKTKLRGTLVGVVVTAVLLVGGSFAGLAMVERREPDPVGEALALARKQADAADRVKAVQYLESAFRLGLLAEDETELERVAAAAEQLGDEFDELGDAPAAEDCWVLAFECYTSLKDAEGMDRMRVRTRSALPRP